MQEFKILRNCLVCASNNLVKFKDLGLQPLANNLKNNAKEEDKKFPILVNECKSCLHKQLSIAVNPNLLFKDYLYQTGTSKSHKDFFEWFCDRISFKFRMNIERSILDIGCNDGTLLSIFSSKGWYVRGVEPCEKIAKEAIKKGIDVMIDFFPTTITRYFDVITAFNVFAHNDNPFEFLREARNLLKENGRIYILTTPARIDNFYHEHISYFTLESMTNLAAQCDLEIRHFNTTKMHGKSHLFEFSKKEDEETPTIDHLMRASFGNNVVICYGAAASGIVLLNYLDFRPDFVIDDNPMKQNKYIPGINVPIYGPEHIKNYPINFTIIILAYHLFDEIVGKIKKLRPNNNDLFVHPLKGLIQ